eukprot:TRINITY_DN522_c0_g1_i3.p1 TRINITY_DN522_c0_g1~~TRINITY_DN522_c0_g1_i3.p1  ORF type:complete len:259 (+),score=93.96 TRINITY_DN522_c0_g1_i3:99-875(+)
MPVKIYTPEKGEGPFPCLIWYHGGGFCIGSIDDYVYEVICRDIANQVGCVVVSVEYRLAPEYKFPTQIEDAYNALTWVYNNSEHLNINPNLLAVGGDSAGGSLSAVMSIMTRDRGGPGLKHQLLIYPCMTNPLTDDVQSHVKYYDGPLLSHDIITWFMDQLFDDMTVGLNHHYVKLLENPDLSLLPPATIINALHDPLSDHGSLYAQKLEENNIPVTHSVYRKSIHGFFGSQLGESSEAMAEACAALRDSFGIDKIVY